MFETDYQCEIGIGTHKVICTETQPLWVPSQEIWKAMEPYPQTQPEKLSLGDRLLGPNMEHQDKIDKDIGTG